MQIANLIGRAKSILLTPRAEWQVIAAEPDTILGIYTGYIMILAAIPAVKLLISARFLGVSILPLVITTYVLSLAGTFFVALIVDALAPTFGGQKDRVQALKVVAYAYTAAWVASIIGIVPGLGLLAALAGVIYGLYLLYLGLPFTMKCPTEKSLGYTVVTVIAAIVVSIVLGIVVRSIGGFGALGGGPLMGILHPQAAGSSIFSDHSATGNALSDYAKRMGDASKQLESAQKSGDAAAKSNALGQFVGTALGSGGRSRVARARSNEGLSAGGTGRIEAHATSSGAQRCDRHAKSPSATATYSDGANRTLQLEIVDSGSLKGVVGFASNWAGVEQERQTDSGYDKTYKKAVRNWSTNSGTSILRAVNIPPSSPIVSPSRSRDRHPISVT